MTLTNVKVGIISAFVLAGVATPLVIQHRAQARLREQNESLSKQVGDLLAENGRLSNSVAQAKAPVPAPSDSLHDLLKLRAQVTRLQADSRELARVKADATPSEMPAWVQQVNHLKQRVEQDPTWRIPEFQFLTEGDWLNAIGKENTLETAADYRQAEANLRFLAKRAFIPTAMAALAKYAAANGNTLPDDPSQLKPYFDSPVDDAVFARYKMLHTGKVEDLASPSEQVMAEKAPVDEVFDSYFTVGLGGWGNSGVGLSSSPGSGENYDQAVKAFKQAHDGHSPTSSSDLQAYLKAPISDDLLKRLFPDGKN